MGKEVYHRYVNTIHFMTVFVRHPLSVSLLTIHRGQYLDTDCLNLLIAAGTIVIPRRFIIHVRRLTHSTAILRQTTRSRTMSQALDSVKLSARPASTLYSSIAATPRVNPINILTRQGENRTRQLDAMSPVTPAGTYEGDRILRSGRVLKRRKRTHVRCCICLETFYAR